MLTGWPVEGYALVGREDIAATLGASQHWQPPTPAVPTWKQSHATAPGATPDLAGLHAPSQLVGATPSGVVPFSLAGATPNSALAHALGAGTAATPALGGLSGRGGGGSSSGPGAGQQAERRECGGAARAGKPKGFAEDWGVGTSSDWWVMRLQALH